MQKPQIRNRKQPQQTPKITLISKNSGNTCIMNNSSSNSVNNKPKHKQNTTQQSQQNVQSNTQPHADNADSGCCACFGAAVTTGVAAGVGYALYRNKNNKSK